MSLLIDNYMQKKIIKILLAISGILLVLLAILFFIGDHQLKKRNFSYKQSAKKEENSKMPITTNKETFKTIANRITNKPHNAIYKTKTIDYLINIAKAFSERYGSYSNQDNFSNLNELKIFTTKKMQRKMQDYINKVQVTKSNKIYYGIITKAVASKVKYFDKNKKQAGILINCYRKEANGNKANSRSFNQDILIKFIKENGIWLIDQAIWK